MSKESKPKFNMDKYWKELSEQYLDSDELGWGAVLYAGMPVWFNKFFNYFQQKAFNDLTGDVNFQGRRVLDVGCGTGRWCLLLKKKGCNVVGIDLERKRLEKAEGNPKLENIDFRQMSVESLDFKDASFDFVNSVTVLQHIPYREKKEAIKEICRVTKKEGHILIMELVDMFDDAPHVFPLSSKDWIGEFQKNGCQLVKMVGYEYSPLLRTLRYLQYLLIGKKTIHKEAGKVKIGRFEWLVLRIVILLSYPIEEICVRFSPAQFARHGVFLFKRL